MVTENLLKKWQGKMATNSNIWDLAEKSYTSNAEKKSPFDIAEKTFKTPYPLEGENDLEREIERNTARLTARGVETIAGLPGDIQSIASGLTGHEFETKFPTRQQLQEKTEQFGQGYLSPKGEFEGKSDELMGDIAAMAIPGGGGYSFARNIGIPVAANLVKEGLMKAGDVKEGNASIAKVGTMLALDLLGNRQGIGMGGVRKYASHLFNEAEKALPEGAMLNAKNFQTSLNNLENTLEQGGKATSKTKALEKISEIQSKIKNGEIEAKELVEFRKTINEAIDEMGGFEWVTKPKIRQRAINNLNDVRKEVIKGLNEYGQTSNPTFLKFHKDANEAYAAIENSDKIKKFLSKYLGSQIAGKATGLLFGAPLGHLVSASTGGLSTALLAGNEALKLFHRVKNSPVLSRYYKNILNAALKGNSAEAISNYKKLDKEIEGAQPS